MRRNSALSVLGAVRLVIRTVCLPDGVSRERSVDGDALQFFPVGIVEGGLFAAAITEDLAGLEGPVEPESVGAAEHDDDSFDGGFSGVLEW